MSKPKKKAAQNATQPKVKVILRSIPCPDLDRRLRVIYEMAYARGLEHMKAEQEEQPKTGQQD